MWGSWFGMTIGGLLVVLLIVAFAFGLSITIFALIFVVIVLFAVAIAYLLKAATTDRPMDRSVQPDPVHGHPWLSAG
jgi:hypothetical protein